MADFVFNIARGRMRQFYDAVDTASTTTQGGIISTANSAIIVVLVETSGLEADATLADYDNLSLLMAGTSNEPAGGTYVRKTIVGAGLAASAEDDTNNRLDLDITADPVWTALTTTGNNAVSALLVCYDNDTTGGTDTSIIPLTKHGFVFTPDGTDVTAVIAAAGFYRSA
jgi:hypothetical protein